MYVDNVMSNQPIQVEIDEYQNYEKALGALSEALKCMNKAKMQDVSTQEAKINFLKRRIALLKKFVAARRYVSYCYRTCDT